MGKKLMPAIALFAAVTGGGALSAHALPADASGSAAAAKVPNPEHAAAMEEYSRLLADYRKDLAAYEADPGEWTAEIPQMPAKPDLPEAVTRQTHSAQR